MKPLKHIALILFSASIVSCGVTPEQAAEYNDKIINQQKAVDDKEVALIDAMKDYSNREGMKTAYDAFLQQINASTEAVKKLEKFDGNTSFADAAIQLFGVYKAIAEKEYKQLIELYSLSDEEFTEEKENESNTLLDAINNGIDTEFEKFKLAQLAFSAKYKIELTKSEE